MCKCCLWISAQCSIPSSCNIQSPNNDGRVEAKAGTHWELAEKASAETLWRPNQQLDNPAGPCQGHRRRINRGCWPGS